MELAKIQETLRMLNDEKLDVRTITMGISLLDCIDADSTRACQKIYDKITTKAAHLVEVGQAIEAEFGIPIVNKRVTVTPIALIAAASEATITSPLRAPSIVRRKPWGLILLAAFRPWSKRAITKGINA